MNTKTFKIKYKDHIGNLWTFTVYGLTFIFPDENSEGFKFVVEKTGDEYYAHLAGATLANMEEVKELVRKKLDEIITKRNGDDD